MRWPPAVPSLNSDITSHFFSKATKLFPVAIRQVVTDNGKEFLGNFDKTLQEASIKHIWTYPYTPKMNATCERFNRTLREQFIEFNELLLFEDLNLFNQRMAEYLVLYNSKRPHKSLELMTPVDYILRESKNCNMWWTHTSPCLTAAKRLLCWCLVKQMASCGWLMKINVLRGFSSFCPHNIKTLKHHEAKSLKRRHHYTVFTPILPRANKLVS